MTKYKRKGISKKVRFNVFKRDGFKCQYCGRSAPDIVLNVDHIHPVCEGGENDELNLITSCFDCNNGKRGHKLDDKTAISKQITQLQELNIRREQLEMISAWRKSVLDIDKQKVDIIVNELSNRYRTETNDCLLVSMVNIWVKKYSMEEIFAAIDKAAEKSWNNPEDAFREIPKYISGARLPGNIKSLLYIRGIVKTRLAGRYYLPGGAMAILTDADKCGVSIEDMSDLAKTITTWTQFKEGMQELMQNKQEVLTE